MKKQSIQIAGLLALAGLGLAQAQSNDSLLQRIEELDQQIRVVARLNEIAQEDAKAAAAKAPKILAGEGGLGVSSADGAYVLKVRGFVQPQAVYLLGNAGVTTVAGTSTSTPPPGTVTPAVTSSAPGIDNFSIKRLQSDILGSVGKQLDYRLHVNFAAGTADVQDAYLDWKIKPEFSFRVGKFKPPTGLERLFSYSRAPFIEASFVPALQPNRDIGIQVGGDFKGLVEYQVAYLAGARDGQNNTTDNNDEKDIYARVFAHPFSKTGNEWLTGFGIGISASTGEQNQYNNPAVTARVVTASAANAPTGTTPTTITTTAAVSNGIASYTTGRQTFFSYAANDTSEGKVTRYSPQAYYYAGPLGIIAEYTATTQNIRRLVTNSATPAVLVPVESELTNTAWAVTASYFITGDKNAYKSIKIKKANTFPNFENIGAIEILGRATGIKIDDKAFAELGANKTETYANASTQASEALGLGLAAKWYLNNSVNIFFAFEQTSFTGGAGSAATAPGTATGANASPVIVDRDAEKVFSTAFNVTF